MSAPAQLPGFLATLAPVLDHWGYAAVAFLLFLEDFGVPAPGETVLIAASVYAGAGRLNVVAVGLVAFAAAVVGDNTGYAIGRFGGRALVLRYGRYVMLTEERLDKAEAFFNRHGGKIVTVARFIEGLRQANGIIAGISGMHWLKFLLFNMLGAALWVATWVSVGYLAGDHIEGIYRGVTRYSLYILAALAVAVLALVVRHLRRRGRPSPQAAESAQPAKPAQSAEAKTEAGIAGADETGQTEETAEAEEKADGEAETGGESTARDAGAGAAEPISEPDASTDTKEPTTEEPTTEQERAPGSEPPAGPRETGR